MTATYVGYASAGFEFRLNTIESGNPLAQEMPHVARAKKSFGAR